jgi:NitT/TauT family transport system permease protein
VIAKSSTTAQPVSSLNGVATHQRRVRLLLHLGQLLLVIAVLLGWQAASSVSAYWKFVLSSPTEVSSLLAHWATSSERWGDLWVTVREAVFGYLLGVGGALVLVCLLLPSAWAQSFITPFVSVLNALPKIVLGPLFIVWFGIGVTGKVYFVASTVFFLAFFGLYAGLTSVDPRFVDNARALGARWSSLVRMVYVPAVLNWLIATLRLSAQWALLTAVIAESLGSTRGIGYQIALGGELLNNTLVLTGVIAIALVALIVDRVLRYLERRYSVWRLF